MLHALSQRSSTTAPSNPKGPKRHGGLEGQVPLEKLLCKAVQAGNRL